MTSSQQGQVSCPSCSHRQVFTQWSSLNATTDPHLKTELLNSALTTLHCPHCGARTAVEYDLLYHDMQRKLAVWLKYPDSQGHCRVDERAAIAFSELADGYTTRRVSNLPELLEKIRIFDDGLDDCLVELAKVLISIRENMSLPSTFSYAGTGRPLFGRRFLRFTEEVAEGVLERRYPSRETLKVAHDLSARFCTPLRPTDRFEHVDQAFVMRALAAEGLVEEVTAPPEHTDRASSPQQRASESASSDLERHASSLGVQILLISAHEVSVLERLWKRQLGAPQRTRLFAEYVAYLVTVADRLAYGKFGDPRRTEFMAVAIDRIRADFAKSRSIGETSIDGGQFCDQLITERLQQYAPERDMGSHIFAAARIVAKCAGSALHVSPSRSLVEETARSMSVATTTALSSSPPFVTLVKDNKRS